MPLSTCSESKTSVSEQTEQPQPEPGNTNDPSASNKLTSQKNELINDFSKPSCSNIVKQTNENETDLANTNLNSAEPKTTHKDNHLPINETLPVQDEIKTTNDEICKYSNSLNNSSKDSCLI